MKLCWICVVLSTFGCLAVEASLRWRREEEIITENPNSTETSVILSTIENELNSSLSVTPHGERPTTIHRLATTRSTTPRTTRPTTSRTTRTTTKRTTVSHTTHHYGRTTLSSLNVSDVDINLNNGDNSTRDNENQESSTISVMHTTHRMPSGSQIKPLKSLSNNQTNHSTKMPLHVTVSEYDEYIYEETTLTSDNNTINNSDNQVSKTPMNDNGSMPDQRNDGSNNNPGPLPDVAPPTKNLLEIIQHVGLTTFLEYIKQAGMEKTLQGPGPFTLFAPSNKAFDALPYFVSNDYLDNGERLKQIMEYHVVKGALLSSELTNDQTIPTLRQNKDIRINIYPVTEKRKLITATGAHISYANYRATNGIIHIIERVLYRIPEVDMVEAISKSSKFKALSDAIEKTTLKTKLKEGPFTLFAPTQFAFQRLHAEDQDRLLNDKDALENILKYHVLPGTYYVSSLKHGTEQPTIENQMLKFSYFSALIRVNNATIVEADIPVTNGVIHAINTILFPPFPNDSTHPTMMMQH